MPEAVEPIVVNSGPFLWLGYCGQIELVHALHARVLTPPVVLEELARQRHWPPKGHASVPSWIEVVPPRSPLAAELRVGLDDGEADVIALALEQGIRLVAIDEARGRSVAVARGLSITGSVGVLVRAKKLGLLRVVRPSLETMRDGGAWLSAELVTDVLRAAGET